MQAAALVAHFRMSPSEERQFRLNLENEAYASIVFDKATQADLFSPRHFCGEVKRLLTRDIEQPDDRHLEEVDRHRELSGGGVSGTALLALAVAAGADPNHMIRPFTYAVCTGSTNIVSRLLDLGADPHAGALCWYPIAAAIEGGHHSIVELLVHRGFNVNCLVNGTTPLGIAAKVGDCQLVNFFLDHGADPNVIHNPRYSCFRTPLERAICRPDRSVVELLLQRGADPNVSDVYDTCSPFMLAIWCEDISFARLMLSYGADWRTCSPHAVSKLPFERFEWFVENSGYAPNVPAPEGESLLELVTAMGDKSKIELLVGRGAQPVL